MTSTEPGRDAIDAALERRYPGGRRHHVTFVPANPGGLQGCSAVFDDGDGHWLFVTYGLTELGGKSEDDDPDWSGWGFELTMRVQADGPAPPQWPFALLTRAAAHVNSQGVVLDDGDRLDLDEGRCSVVRDRDLGEIVTPNGRVVFLRVEL